MSATPNEPRLTEAEWTLMRVLWRRRLCTVREVLDDVVAATGWAYTTVKTQLDRLVEKGLVATETRAGTRAYRALITQRRARLAATHELVRRAFDGAVGPLLHQLVASERLSRTDLEELKRRLLELEETSAETPAAADEERGRREDAGSRGRGARQGPKP